MGGMGYTEQEKPSITNHCIKAVNLTMPGGTAAQMASIPTAPMSFLSPVTPSQVHQNLPLDR